MSDRKSLQLRSPDETADAKEVLKELLMEFAVEAQKLLAISLEGSVG